MMKIWRLEVCARAALWLAFVCVCVCVCMEVLCCFVCV